MYCIKYISICFYSLAGIHKKPLSLFCSSFDPVFLPQLSCVLMASWQDYRVGIFEFHISLFLISVSRWMDGRGMMSSLNFQTRVASCLLSSHRLFGEIRHNCSNIGRCSSTCRRRKCYTTYVWIYMPMSHAHEAIGAEVTCGQ